MRELKWNWVYYPYLDAPNKQEESALKAGYIKVVIKDEADAVIKELKAQKAQVEDDCAYWKMSEGNAVTAMHETEEYAMQLYNELRHQKYKRCLAMEYVERLKQMILCNYPDSILYRRAARRERKWKKIAEKFKPNNSTARRVQRITK